MKIHGHLRYFALKGNDHESDESNELFVLFVPFVFGKRWCGYPCLANPVIGLQKVFTRPSAHPRMGAIGTPMPVRTRSVPAPTVHRLFNGFLSERGRRGCIVYVF